jgi:hypothetical protein
MQNYLGGQTAKEIKFPLLSIYTVAFAWQSPSRNIFLAVFIFYLIVTDPQEISILVSIYRTQKEK